MRSPDFLCNFTPWVCIEMTCIETALDWNDQLAVVHEEYSTAPAPIWWVSPIPFCKPWHLLNFLLSKTSISLSPWSINVVAGCPLDHLPCFGPEGSRWETISVDLASATVATKLTAAGILGDLLNLESGPPRPGASLSDNNYVVIPLTDIQSNW